MNIYPKRPRKDLIWKKILINLVILFFLILLLNLFQSQVRNYFYSISSPITAPFLFSGNKVSEFFDSFLSSKNLKRDNSNLKEENQKLISEVTILKDTITENRAEKEAIKNTEKYNYKIIPAKVVGLYASNDFMLINKGSDDGVFEGMPIISSQKVLYGRVFKVYKNFSQVMLISSKNSVLNAKIQENELTQKPVYGIVRGEGSLSLSLDLVNYDAEIKEDDVVVTSGLEGTFPVNLLVGRIKSINVDDLKEFQTAPVQPFFGIENMDNVFVITNYLRI